MTFFRREGENPMKHFGSYLTIAGAVPYVIKICLNKSQIQVSPGQMVTLAMHHVAMGTAPAIVR